jgi:hypothetical protein
VLDVGGIAAGHGEQAEQQRHHQADSATSVSSLAHLVTFGW